MNTSPKELKRVRGANCEHVSLVIAGETIRSARREVADTDRNGKPVTAPCPFPRCEIGAA